MRYTPFVQSLCIGTVLVMAAGCGDSQAPGATAKLQSATSVSVSYLLKKRDKDDTSLVSKSFRVTRENKKRALLDALVVRYLDEGVAASFEPACVVTLGWDDGTTLELHVIAKDKLVVPSQQKGVTLSGNGFYDKLCELISKEEGKKTDPLKELMVE